MLLTNNADRYRIHWWFHLQRAAAWMILVGSTFLLSACPTSHWVPPSPTSDPQVLMPDTLYAAAAVAAPELLRLERNSAAARDLSMLAALWTDDAVIRDGRNTATPDDDYRWQGRDAILDRYVLAVFPAAPPPVDSVPAVTFITQDEHSAEVRNGVDRWVIRRIDGRWYLHTLTYQQP